MEATERLTRHFVRHFLENVPSSSAGVDSLAFVGGAFVSASLFVTVLLCIKFVGPIVTPGRAALRSLDDKFLFMAYSMTIMALAAVSAWDALGLDVRDITILGVLPVPTRMIVRAKFRATMLFIGALLALINFAPAVLYPILMVSTLPVGITGVATLVVTHACVMCLAGLFGFLSVLAIREVGRAILGAGLFQRVSTPLRALLAVPLVVCFILVPLASSDVGRSVLDRQGASVVGVPPLWFVGMYETAAGRIVDGLPRRSIPRRLQSEEAAATVTYRGSRDLFARVARIGLLTTGLIALFGAGAYAWNGRSLPLPPPPQWSAHGKRRAGTAIGLSLVRGAGAQAGFFFALQTLRRSERHRAWVALGIAGGLAAALLILNQLAPRGRADLAAAPVGLLAVQGALLIAVLTGFRHAMRIPADVRGSVAFYLSWCGDDRPFMAGVQKAGFVALVVPTVALLFLIDVIALGQRIALVHLICGLLSGALALKILCSRHPRIPFVSDTTPASNIHVRVALYTITSGLAVFGLGAFEHVTLRSSGGEITLITVLVILLGLVSLVERLTRREHSATELERWTVDDGGAQRLNLID